ncbi:MAG TPA: alcohol dehydrogenase catalytic domain-containing protein [Mycobacteriales bacterium]|nr:alcohol dehydrogenase catalytic domain-containing protein [Mycobacteriales bacterium]
MRAFVVTGPRTGGVEDVPTPIPGPNQVVVDVARAGICGTDVGMHAADLTGRHGGRTGYPLRLGHEWSGRVRSIGPDVDPSWISTRVTGETMLGCGDCEHCAEGNPNLCADRYEIGVRGNWPGAFAERLLVPVTALHRLPPSISDDMGAMIEPGANACRAAEKTQAGPGSRVLVIGPGTIGLLAAGFARARGAEVHVLGVDERSLVLGRAVGVHGAWTADDLPDLTWNAVIDASGAAGMSQFAVEKVRPGGRVVLIGSSRASTIQPGMIIHKDLTVAGVLGGSQGFPATVEAYASGRVDPTPLIATTVPLRGISSVLNGHRDDAWEARPKILVNPKEE